eukprot:Opistho-1_new@69373
MGHGGPVTLSLQGDGCGLQYGQNDRQRLRGGPGQPEDHRREALNPRNGDPIMQIKIASVLVEDQDKVLRFYTEQLGFTKMADIPMGPTYRWLTVVSPEGVQGVELALEPMAFPPAQVYQNPCTLR